MKGVLNATLHCATNLKFKIWDGHIIMASHGSCAHILAEREVGKKYLVILVSTVRGSSYLLRILKCWGRLWILGRGSDAGDSRRMSKFTAVRMRECGIFLLFIPSIFFAPVGFLDSLFLRISIQNLF